MNEMAQIYQPMSYKHDHWKGKKSYSWLIFDKGTKNTMGKG